MSPWAALAIGLILGVAYPLIKRVFGTSNLKIPGGAVLLKWPQGIGRSSVIEVRSNTVLLSFPVMRTDFNAPTPGADVILKPLDGGPALRGKFLTDNESGWTVSMAS